MSKITRVCGDCWYDVRPDQYEPFTFIDGTCDRCGASNVNVHRVSRAELDATPPIERQPFSISPEL